MSFDRRWTAVGMLVAVVAPLAIVVLASQGTLDRPLGLAAGGLPTVAQLVGAAVMGCWLAASHGAD